MNISPEGKRIRDGHIRWKRPGWKKHRYICGCCIDIMNGQFSGKVFHSWQTLYPTAEVQPGIFKSGELKPVNSQVSQSTPHSCIKAQKGRWISKNRLFAQYRNKRQNIAYSQT